MEWLAEEEAHYQIPLKNQMMDVATGSGDVVILASQQLRSYSKIIGVDLSENMLKIARHKAQSLPSDAGPTVEFVHGDGRSLPSSPSAIHTLTIAFGLRNIHGTAAALAEFHRVLKEGGTLMVLEFMRPRPSSLQRLFWRVCRVVFSMVAPMFLQKKQDYVYLPNSVMSFMTVDELESMAAQVGFEIQKTHRFFMGVCHLMSFRKIESSAHHHP